MSAKNCIISCFLQTVRNKKRYSPPLIFLIKEYLSLFSLLSDKSFSSVKTKVIPNTGVENHNIKYDVENYRMTGNSTDSIIEYI